jgi:RNA polymerase sigma-70 factor, ECF subfamily
MMRIVGMKETDESKIIRSIIDGSDRYAELVERYHVGLIIHCEQLVGDRDEAEDVAQEAFVKAYMQLRHYDASRARFSTWLYKIATNEALDYLRKNKRRVNVDDLETIAEATMPEYIEEDERRYVRQTVKELQPPEQRRVIEAYFWEGKSYQEIADEMQAPLNTVRTWIRRAKLQLKEKLS